MCDIDEYIGTRENRKNKKAKITELLPVLLVVYGYSISEIGMYVSSHPILDSIEGGFFSANKRINLFYTDEMHNTLLDDIGEDVKVMGISNDDDFSKQSVLFELFTGEQYGGRSPRRKEQFRSTITLHLEPSRYKRMM